VSEEIQAIPPFVEQRHAPFIRRRAALPTARQWVRHTALLMLTALTATLSGIMFASTDAPEPALAAPVNFLDYIFYVPEYYLKLTGGFIQQAIHQPALLAQGMMFAASLLLILATHEAGHYIACRRYGVDATLPFFIPTPPLLGVGTFGAFIKIKSPIPSRRALFDIGVAGPLAGFAVAVPIAVAGLLTLQPPLPVTDGGAIFNDPLLFRLIARALGVNLSPTSPTNPFYLAAWVGLLVTSLNLMPVGQLDGGHATYSIFGARTHKMIGRLTFVTMFLIAILGWTWHRSMTGFLWTVLLAIMLRVRHPQAGDEREPLGRARLIVAAITLVVFILSFVPFPITFM
jgi:membrane-associated protease RseP (regulator of RpoE activity)